MNTRRPKNVRDSKLHRLWKSLTAFLAVFAMSGWFFLWWLSRPPAVSLENLKYIQLLRTAVSSQSKEMLLRVEGAIEELASKQQVSDSEYQHFAKIISVAREGRWQQADRMAYAFEEAQLSRSR